jgi:hypothetical protein
MAQIHDEPRACARVPSRFEIANSLAWILARANELRAGDHDAGQALDHALQEHEAILASTEKRASVGVYQVAREVWAGIEDEDDMHVLAWILSRAADARGDGREHHDAIDQAIAECHGTWEQVTRRRMAEAHEVARHAWAAVSGGDPRVEGGSIVDALDGILERAEALHRDGRDPGDAIAHALNECRASRDLARVAFAAWAFTVGENEVGS